MRKSPWSYQLGMPLFLVASCYLYILQSSYNTDWSKVPVCVFSKQPEWLQLASGADVSIFNCTESIFQVLSL